MKKLTKTIMMLSIASLAMFSSCKKDDTNAAVTDVKVDVAVSPASPIANTPVTLTITCTGNTDNKLSKISVTRTDGAGVAKTVLSKSLTGTSSTQTVIDTLPLGSFTYVIAVDGEKGSPATATKTVVTRALPGPIDVSGTVSLFGQTNIAGTNENFSQLVSPYATYSTTTYKVGTNKTLIDLAFFYGTANKATVTSPDDATMQGLYSGLDWSGVNKTKLTKTTLSTNDFDLIAASNSDSAITALASTTTTWSGSVNLLAAGNVLLFQTAGNKVGLVKVENISVTTGASDAEISLRVISQK